MVVYNVPDFSRIAATDIVAPGLASLIFDSTRGMECLIEIRPRANTGKKGSYISDGRY
jgi:hypothetical protein